MRTLPARPGVRARRPARLRARSVDERAGARRARAGVDADALLYDLLLGDGRHGAAVRADPELRRRQPRRRPRDARPSRTRVPGLSDGGAHVGTICDGSFPTTLLDALGSRPHARRALRAALARASASAADTAAAVGLLDRGVLAPGYRADINVIDFDRLGLGAPHLVFDLPAGGKRLLQRATGYRHTFVAGAETFADGEATGALPGRLVRGAQPAPARLDGVRDEVARSSRPTRTSPSRRTPTSTTSTRRSATARRR